MAQLQPILCETISVVLRLDNRVESSAQQLVLKVSGQGIRSSSAIGSKIVIELTWDSDLLFYFSSVITDVDFHGLKQEQRLLVDLFQFPEMIRQLVKLPSVVLTLTAGPSAEEAVLSVTETSQFREITHLSLKLRKGSDEAVKSHLAARLAQYKARNQELETQVQNLSLENHKLSSDRDMCVTELTRLRVDTDAAVAAIQATCRAQLADLREDHAKEIRDLHVTSSSEHSSETRRLMEEVREKDVRVRDLERRFDEIRTQLMSAETGMKVAESRASHFEHLLAGRESEVREMSSRTKKYEEKISELSAELVDVRNSMSPELSKLQSKNKELKRVLKDTQHALLEQERVVDQLTADLHEAKQRLTESSGLGEELLRTQKKLAETQELNETNSRLMSYIGGVSGRAGLPSPVHTPSLIPDFPNRSLGTDFMSKSGLLGMSANMSVIDPPAAVTRTFKGPVKFTARTDSKQPPLLK